MGCMCAECRFAKKTDDPNLVLCDNWESEYYGSEMDDRGDSCDFGEVDMITKALEGLVGGKMEC